MKHRIPSIGGLILIGLLGSSCGPLGTPLTPLGRACHTNADCRTQELCLKEQGNCESTGWCRERPILSGATLPVSVCGCDGHTYGSVLAAEAQGVNVAYGGKCPGER